MQRIVQKLPVVFVIVAYIVLGYSFFHFIYSYTISIPFADEWGLTDMVLDNKIRLQYFFTQTSEHRVGTGYIYLQFLSHLTHWKLLYETMSIGILLLISSFFALRIKQYFTKSIDYWDVVIPFIFLNLTQQENLIWGIEIVHILPTFFLLWTVYLFTKQNSSWKYHLLLCIALLSAYSHFHGLVVGFIILGYFLSLLIHAFKKRNGWQKYLYYSVAVVGILGSYFIGIYPSPYLGPQHMTVAFLFQFIGQQINAAIGIRPQMFFFWVAPFAVTGSLCISMYWYIKKRFDQRYYPIISLLFYSLTFILFITLGRSGLGIEAAQTSRYVTYLSPLFFSMYLIGRMHLKGWKIGIGIAVLILYVYGSMTSRQSSIKQARAKHDEVEQWRNCYLRTESIETCDTQTQAIVYYEDISILKRHLDGLKQQKLNLFSP